MADLRNSIGGLAMLVSAAVAAVPYQAQAEEQQLDCSAKTYFEMRKQLEIEGKDGLAKLLNVVRSQPKGEIIGIYFGPKKMQEGQFKAEFGGDDYVGRTFSLTVEYSQGKEIGTINVAYTVETKPERTGRTVDELSLERVIITAPDGRIMHPSYEKEQEYSARPKIAQIAMTVATALVDNILESFFMPVRSRVAQCKAHVLSDYQVVRNVLGITEEEEKDKDKKAKAKPSSESKK